MYIMGTLLRHGSEAQKREYLPRIASGELRLQAFGVTEPTSGTDTTRIRTSAVRDGDRYVVNGQKVWTSRAEHSDLLLLFVRTTPLEQVEKKTDGLSVLLVDLRTAVGNGLTIRPLRAMMNHATTEMFFDNLEVPAANLIGPEGGGFRCLLDGLNAERILIAAECVGDGRWFIERAVSYANERVVFDRPIGKNQGIQFPLARAHVNVESADLMRIKAAELFDAGQPCGGRVEHGQAAGGRRRLGGGQRGRADVRRVWLRSGVRRGAQVPRVPPLPGGAGIHQSHPVLHRPARARPAAVVLMGARPLGGVTVVSLEQAVAAPFATRQLADLGARVIKIEAPRGRRLRPGVRQHRPRAVEPLRLAEPARRSR